MHPERAERKKCFKNDKRRQRKLDSITAVRDASAQYDREWPAVVPNEVVFHCLNRFHEGSKWVEPPVCAICGQYKRDVVESVASDLELGLLRLTDPLLIQKCVIQRVSPIFTYVNPALDGLMLERRGVLLDNAGKHG